ncbi:hypothetical protein FH972_012596 [Carpinus fangiana]|uniref:Uncharacterized protein n=1 Tax=Carpinus fangiana TaxID=176857 RepID=A0A5N6R7E5_9ROSI|nr:hypothetical protein FH972_012596 [Carpinus fangiana]
MPAHRALPVRESSIDKHMIESQAAQHDHNIPESTRPETLLNMPAWPSPSMGLFPSDLAGAQHGTTRSIYGSSSYAHSYIEICLIF